jgi:hypothetical protein
MRILQWFFSSRCRILEIAKPPILRQIQKRSRPQKKEQNLTLRSVYRIEDAFWQEKTGGVFEI